MNDLSPDVAAALDKAAAQPGQAEGPDQWVLARTGPEDEAGFPDDYQGAGPMFAAVPLGNTWLDAASKGQTTYILESPFTPDGMTDQQATEYRHAYAGHSAFLDRATAEAMADHPFRHGTFCRWEGLMGWNDWTDKNEREHQAAVAELEAGL